MRTIRRRKSGARGLLASAFVLLALTLCQPVEVRAQWTTNGNDVSNTNTGNVGIGTAAPSALLTVQKDQATGTEIRVSNTNASGFAGLYLNSGLAQTSGGFLQWNNNTGSNNLFVGTGGANPLHLGTNNNIRMTVLPNSGNVGIGTTSPNGLFNISANSASKAVRSYLTDLAGAANRKNFILENYLGDLYFSRIDDDNSSNATSRMVIQNTGNVGIGTTSPSTKLQVIGAARFDGTDNSPSFTVDATAGGIRSQGFSSPTSGTGIEFGYYAAGPYAFLQGYNRTGNVYVPVAIDGSNLMINQHSGGSVGIGTATPNALYKLDVAGSINALNGLCINGTCKGSWSEVGGTGQWATGGSNVYFNTGNVGVGAAAPAVKFAVGGNGVNVYATDAWVDNNLHAQGNEPLAQGGRGRLRVGTAWGYMGLYTESSSSGAANDLVLGSGSSTVRVGPGGAIVQNLTVPNGDLNVTGTGNITASGTITGGNIQAKYQDVAEWVPSTQELKAGTVVVLDAERNNHVLASSEAYDTRVAGVVSAQPGLLLGEGGAGKVMVATTGRVRVRVDATRSPVRIGDLLVTSGAEGMAMKSEPVELVGRKMHAPGTIIGKALEPLEKGVGEILVLLSLQ